MVRLGYSALKGVVRRFVAKVTGLSKAQTTRLIAQYHKTGRIEDRRRGATRPFERRYRAADIALLAEVDETLGGLCGPATRRVMRRQPATRRVMRRQYEAVEFATLEWVHGYNHRRLFESLGYVPPAEFEAHYYHQLRESAMAA